MTSKDLTEQGVAALKEGDKPRAQGLLERAVELDPNNAKAWYFLSRVQTSVEEKRTSLNTVLAIMPDNRLAREALDNLSSADEDFDEFEEEIEEPVASSSSYSPSESQPNSMSSLPRMGIGEGVKPQIGNFTLPVSIEDAPISVMPQTIVDEFVATFKNGVEILRRTPSIYPMEMQQATWWKFWQFVIASWLIGAVVSTISGFIIQAQLATAFNNNPFMTEAVASPSILSSIFSLLLFIPISGIVLYVGLYASYRFITSKREGQASFLVHSYTIILPLVTAGLITDVANLVFSIAPLLGSLVSLALFALWIFSMYIAAQGLAIAHKVAVNSGYWTMAVLALSQVVAAFIILLIVSPLILSSSMGVF